MRSSHSGSTFVLLDERGPPAAHRSHAVVGAITRRRVTVVTWAQVGLGGEPVDAFVCVRGAETLALLHAAVPQ